MEETRRSGREELGSYILTPSCSGASAYSACLAGTYGASAGKITSLLTSTNKCNGVRQKGKGQGFKGQQGTGENDSKEAREQVNMQGPEKKNCKKG